MAKVGGEIERIIARLKENGLQAEHLYSLKRQYMDTIKATENESGSNFEEASKEESEEKDPFKLFAEFLEAHPDLAIMLTKQANPRGSLFISATPHPDSLIRMLSIPANPVSEEQDYSAVQNGDTVSKAKKFKNDIAPDLQKSENVTSDSKITSSTNLTLSRGKYT